MTVDRTTTDIEVKANICDDNHDDHDGDDDYDVNDDDDYHDNSDHGGLKDDSLEPKQRFLDILSGSTSISAPVTR